ncbi:hypothetical protein FRB94_003610 [Tulasnella sp. JGI-2019a]|nr:hypothetical protein FRB93_004478 [Tulasnella sp. JGI-2019a]KAG9013170.1 hypothetical protein FRB94_003610 [Tulasnella sp. JGI-2019a]
MFDWIRRVRPPPLSYSITRDVEWKWDPVIYLVAAIAFIILIPVNYALTGYETVTQPSPIYKPIEHHWYDAFAKKSPEAPCDSYKFTVGDSFITTASIFTYQLAYISGGEGTSSTIAYTGQTLEECDVAYMSATADARFKSYTIAAHIACRSEVQFPVVFATSFRSDGPLTADWTVSPLVFKEVDGPMSQSFLFLDVDKAMASAGADLVGQVANAFEDFTSIPGPLLLSAEALPIGEYPPWWCTPSFFNTNSTCGTAVPPISLYARNLYDATGKTVSNATLPTNYNLTINNAMQTMLAAIRIDLGNILPNNFLVHRTPDVIGRTISSTIPIKSFQPTPTSLLYTLIANGDSWLNGHAGLANINPNSVTRSQITLQYQCQVKQKKSAGSIFIAVTVATLTLFNNGWGIVTALLIFLALRHRPHEKKLCAGNGVLEAKIQDLERQAVEKAPGGGDDSEPVVQASRPGSSTASLPRLGQS